MLAKYLLTSALYSVSGISSIDCAIVVIPLSFLIIVSRRCDKSNMHDFAQIRKWYFANFYKIVLSRELVAVYSFKFFS